MAYDYLIGAANEFLETLSDPSGMAPDDLVRVLYRGSEALDKVLEKEGCIAELAQTASTHGDELAELKNNLYKFVSGFLIAEEEALWRAGLNERAAKMVLWAASAFHYRLDHSVDAKAVIEAIKDLRSVMIDTADQLHKRGPSSFSQTLETAQRYGPAFMGVIMLYVNVYYMPQGVDQNVSIGLSTNVIVAEWRRVFGLEKK